MRVNLFIIGAMKGGTHAAMAALGSHPAVAAARFKEPSHFVDRSILERRWPRPLPYQDESAYMSLFDVRPETRYLCEASVLYTQQPAVAGVARRIRDYNPDARLVYMVRDPLRRIISQFFQERRSGNCSGTFAETVRGDIHYAAYSDYAMQLAPYLELFPRENIRIVISERFQARTAAEAESLFRWLALDAAAARMTTTDHHVTPALVGVPRGLLARTKLRDTALWKLGRKYTPWPVERMIKGLLYTDNLKPSDISADDIDQDTRARVAANAVAFYDLIGGPVAEWRDTNDAIARYAR